MNERERAALTAHEEKERKDLFGRADRRVVPDQLAQQKRLEERSVDGDPFVIVDALANGTFRIKLYANGALNASYSPVSLERALGRNLPEALAEARSFAQSSSGSEVTE